MLRVCFAKRANSTDGTTITPASDSGLRYTGYSMERGVKNGSRGVSVVWLVWLISLIVLLFGGILVFAPPNTFPEDAVVTIEPGTSGIEVAHQLKQERVISSSVVFMVVMRARGKTVYAGTYSIPEPRSLWGVTSILSQRPPAPSEVTVTIPEGFASYQIAARLAEALPGFDAEAFYQDAKLREGYLFPETYRLYESATPEEVLALLEEQFDERITPLREAIDASPYTLHEVLTLASILEKEARQYETMRMVMGVLQNRLTVGMPLQVDAVFGYMFETDTFHPSPEDLLVDSPYNTYRYAGLPPGPINNPGIDAIRAVLNPIENPYFYYLTGNDGGMHYAETYPEHLINRRRYLE